MQHYIFAIQNKFQTKDLSLQQLTRWHVFSSLNFTSNYYSMIGKILALGQRRFFKAIAIAFVGLNCGITSSIAQDNKEWTLSDCIEYAYENNIDIKQSQLQKETSDADLLQSKLDLFPSISASATHQYDWGRSLSNKTNQFVSGKAERDSYGISAELDLINGFRKVNTIKKYKYDSQADLFDVETTKNNIALQITSTYLQVLFNKELVKSQEAQVEVSEKQVERTQKLVDAGSMARGDLLNVKSQLATDRENLIKYENQLYISLVDLQQLLDLPVSRDFAIDSPEISQLIEESTLAKPKEVFSKAVGIMPEIKSAEMRLNSAEKTVQVYRGQLYPSISMGGRFSSIYYDGSDFGATPDPFIDQFNDNLNQSLYFSLNIPIFNNYVRRTNLNKAKISAINAEYNLASSKLKLRKQIESAYTDAITSWRAFQSAKASVSYYQESFRYTEQKYEVGLVSSYDYNLAKSNLTTAESSLLRAKYEYIFKVKVLEFYLGNPLTL